MATAVYRFLPWARRGLAGAITQKDTGQPLPQRAGFPAGLTVEGAGSAGVELSLYGPGDIIGLDPRTIIRTEPRPHSTDAEPNYLVAIEFDLPELPWMFSPAAADANERLRPWIALIVLETAGPGAVALPRVEAGRPLPTITLTTQQAADQLPDLAQSWAWAHGQLMVDGAADTLAALSGNGDLNLSRLVCPRRLSPKTSYMACVVPAFDVGVVRGLGGTPTPDAVAGPAWIAGAGGTLTLPVMFHWEFATGPDGDFESLARLLKPYRCPPTAGTAPMYIWDALPGLTEQATAEARAKPVRMEGALRASEGVPATLDQIEQAFQDAIRAEVDAPADLADGAAPGTTRAIAAPIYGGFHAKTARVPAGLPAWLRELNLDPRARAAAGLGADVVRANQEAFMQACWEQAGKVIEANALLNRARLAAEALARLHGRIATLPAADLLSLATAAKTRIPLDDLTLAARVERTSLPDALLTGAFRRAASPRRTAVRLAARMNAAPTARIDLIAKLAPGSASVDPNNFVPDGIVAVQGIDQLAVDAGGRMDLSALGIKAVIGRGDVAALSRFADAGRAVSDDLTLSADLGRTGILTEAHVAATQAVVAATADALPVATVLTGLMTAARRNNRVAAYLLDPTPDDTAAPATPIDVDGEGRVLLRTPSTRASRVIATFGADVARGGVADMQAALMALPVGTFGGSEPLAIERGVDGRVAAGTYVMEGRRRLFRKREVAGGRGVAVAEPVRDPAVVGRFTAAFERLRAQQGRDVAEAAPHMVPFDVDAAAIAATQRIDPRRNVPARVASMISIGPGLLAPGSFGPLFVPDTVDRIMVAPDLPEPAYQRLAEHDREAFVPGISAMPRNTLTLMETNPRFIEAYMIGLNHEMNRELLWRSYPTDQRGTPFRRFWDWEDGAPDIDPIHAFSRFAALGHSTRGGAKGGNLVLLVRGDLLRRYPNSAIYAWKAAQTGAKVVLTPNPAEDARVSPAFYGRFDPDISFVGFDLTREDIVASPGWFFVIEQQMTEPRFGFDDSAGAMPAFPGNWLDAQWADTGTDRGRHLRVDGRLAGHGVRDVTYGHDAAHMAALTLQRPFRLAVHARHLTQI